MKILATADWHIGAGKGFGHGEYGSGSRLHDQEQVLERIVDLAIDEGCDLFLFAGDMWHRPRPTPWEIATAQRPLLRLAEAMPIIAIHGNTHDVINAELPTALEVAFLGKIRVSREPERIDVGGATICTLPWVPTSKLVAELGHRTDTDAIHRDTAELLVHVARGLRAECADGVPAILVAHWSATGASTPTGAMTDEFREPVLPLGELEAMGWDAVVLGHIHKPQDLTQNPAPPIFYCGSPAVVDFGEAESGHGVSVLTWNGHGFATRWEEIPDRRFVTVEADLLGVDDAGDVLAKYALAYPGGIEGAVARVRYRATADQAKHVDHAALTRALYDAGAHHVYGIQAEIVREDRARVAGVDETLSPLQALDLWAVTQEIVPEIRERLRARTLTFLEAVDAC